MTVEEKCSKVTSVEDRGELMKTIFEVTGITSREVIESAVKACRDEHGRHKIDDVIAYLVQNNTNHSSVQVSRDRQLMLAEDSKSKNVVPTLAQPHNSGAVIDLTAENAEDDLQQAIAESLKDNPPGVSREEQEISRVIEVSLKDSKPGSKRKRTDAGGDDSADPTTQRRDGSNPVGIKNIGLTCWFSSVVQTLFHLPIFRNLVLHYGPVTRPQDTPALKFMQELRELFALMLCTRRRFVDPTNAVEILKQSGGFGTGGSTLTSAVAQEDVNEFKHKLFDLLEEAFKADRKRSSPALVAQGSKSQETKVDENPMISLFRGRTKVERVTATGTVSTNEEEFGQWILSVDRVNNIHESIEASIVGYVEGTSCGSELPQNSAQEQWFVKLPPFLTFELLRANFNQQLHRAEKLHNKFTFPDGIYLDRYVEKNKEVIRRKRAESKALKEQLTDLQSRLDRYINFGSGNKRFPLREVLQCTLEFASSSGTSQADRSPSPMLVTPGKGPSSGSPTDERMDIPSPSAAASPAPMDFNMSTPSSSPAKLNPVLPAPRHITRNELRVLQECLTRWRTEVETDIKEIHNSITTIESQIANIYEGEELKKHYYQLHSVVVHDGQASSGHYWAYVRSFSHENRWLKFNDVAVTEADWEELERDGAGGYLNTSAYCLIYVDANVLRDMPSELPTVESAYQSLPDDLKLVVDADWLSLASEVITVSETTSETLLTNGRAASSVTEASTNTTPARQLGLPVPETLSETALSDPCNRHAALLASWVQLSLNGSAEDPATGLVNLNELAHDVYVTLKRRSRQLPSSIPLRDSRLVHIVVYLLECTKLSAEDIKLNFIIDQIRRLGRHSDERMNKVVELANQHIASHQELFSTKQLQDLHEQYNLFRKTAALFVQGAKLFHVNKYDQAVKWLFEAYQSNEQLLRLYDSREHDSSKRQYAAVDAALLSYYRRTCLLHVNEIAARQFEQGNHKSEKVANTVRSIISPGLHDLTDSGIAADSAAAEEIRKKWCDFLNNEESLPESQAEGLKKMLEVLLDAPSEQHSSAARISVEDLGADVIGPGLQAEYDQVMADAHQHHYLDVAVHEFKGVYMNA